MRNKWGKLALAFVICQGAGILGAGLTAGGSSAWYLALSKPALNPPSWIFGPVWFLLYTLMAVAVWRIWQRMEGSRKARSAFLLFWIHLGLNALWTPVFFGLQNVGAALVILSALFLFVAYLNYLFWKIDRLSGWLMLPYLFWIAFALYLNYAIFVLN